MERPQLQTRAIWPLIKLTVFTLLVPCSVTVWLPLYFFDPSVRAGFAGWGISALAGIVLIVLGAAGYLWCALDFAFVGRGTPAPIDPPKVLVVRGLYRFVRNPMYVSVGTVLLGESLLFQSWTLLRYTAIAWAIIHLVVIFYEEPVLRSKFSGSYEDYCRAVPRWLPRFRRAVSPSPHSE